MEGLYKGVDVVGSILAFWIAVEERRLSGGGPSKRWAHVSLGLL